MSIEGLNTAVEKIDFIHPIIMKIGFIKDIAAELFFAAITAIIIGLIIYVQFFRHSTHTIKWKTTKKRTFRQEKQFKS
jgi:diacylglycerol kinase